MFRIMLIRGSVVVIALFAAFAAFAYWYDSTGQQPDLDYDTRIASPTYNGQRPRVAFDLAHHEWHTPTYRYKPLANLLRNDGYIIETNEVPFVAGALHSIDVLIIPNAVGPKNREHWAAFTPAEDTVVREWVKGGGSLLLVADHVPFGAAAENLAAQFGIKMYLAFARDDVNSGWDNERLVFTRENGLLADHAITKGRSNGERVNRVETFTGQSVSVPEGATALLTMGTSSYDWKSRHDRSSAKGHAQAVALPFGQGRVVILGEAALLTAQKDPLGLKVGMNKKGNDDRQFALNIFHWLSRSL